MKCISSKWIFSSVQALICALTIFYVGESRADWVPNPDAGLLEFTAPLSPAYEGESSVTLKVKRTGGNLGYVSVSYYTIADTATAGSDFQSASGQLYWGDGDWSEKTITVPIVNDSIIEDDEDFYVRLYSPTHGASLGTIYEAQVKIVTRDLARLPSYMAPRQMGGAGLLGGYLIENAYHEVTGAGDINADGQDDIALGAAFERPDACAEGAAYALWDLPVGSQGTLNAYSQEFGRLGGVIAGQTSLVIMIKLAKF